MSYFIASSAGRKREDQSSFGASKEFTVKKERMANANMANVSCSGLISTMSHHLANRMSRSLCLSPNLGSGVGGH